MSFEPRDFLRHMLDEADYLASASAGIQRDRYDSDETLQRAFVRSLEVIGEAATKVDPAAWRPWPRDRLKLCAAGYGTEFQRQVRIR